MIKVFIACCTLAACLAVIEACGHRDRSHRVSDTNPLEEFVSGRLAAGAGRHCEQRTIEIVEGPPANTSHDLNVESCSARTGDTIEYTYRDTTGRLLVVGQQMVRTYPIELWQDSTVAGGIDAMRAIARTHLVARYGASGRCPPRPALGEAPEQWATKAYYVLLNTGRAPGFGVVTLERWLGEPSCHVEGAPHAR
jgi:hypothetical protein